LHALFSKRGWDVAVARTVAEALPLLAADPDWVILDLMLPDGAGEVVLERIRATGSKAKVVVTTGVFDESRLAALEHLRPETVLHKPINVRELLRLLR
jgi:DNA-binding response OmpR family regulator